MVPVLLRYLMWDRERRRTVHRRTVVLLLRVIHIWRVHVTYAGERRMRTLISHAELSKMGEVAKGKVLATRSFGWRSLLVVTRSLVATTRT